MSGITTGSSHLLADPPLLNTSQSCLETSGQTVLGSYPANVASCEQAFNVCVHQFKMFENIFENIKA